MSEKLSIAIPTYNRLPYLKECINSILNQTFQDFSIFVFDNASDEPVEEELKKFNDERIRFIGNDKNIGTEGNINRILKYPFESEYLIIFHDDDLMHPRMFELQTSFLDINKDVIFVVSDLNRVSSKNIHNFKRIIDKEIKYTIYNERNTRYIGRAVRYNEQNARYAGPITRYKNNYEFAKAIISWLRCAFDSAMYRSEVIRNARMKPDEFSDFADMVLLMEISKKGPCAFIDAPLVNYRVHSGQYSELPKKEYEQGAIKTLSFCRESLPTVLNKRDGKLLKRYSLNFLLRAYADINKGFFDFLRFAKRCRQQNLIKYSYFRYIDMRGIVSLVSIILKNKKIINTARTIKDFFGKK